MRVVVDTNSLIRFFTDDIPEKAEMVEVLLEKEKHIFIPDVVLPELEYILTKAYGFPRGKLVEIYLFLSSQMQISLTKEASQMKL